MIYVSLIIILAYILLIILFSIGFDNVKIFDSFEGSVKNRFSIIVPFRNEAKNLPSLLQSIEKLHYPKELFEVLFVNDESEDNSVKIIERFFANAQNDIQILENIRSSNSPKKDAIETAINTAKNEWIVTTDADCILPERWLQVFDTFIQQHKPYFIAAPVTYPIAKNFLNRFQLLDILSLQGATIGGFGIRNPFLCNGANLCYKKAVFLEINGFSGNEKITSGDDIFLMEKIIKKYPEKVHYLKSNGAIVLTQPQPTISDLLHQRKRWAAKSTHYQNIFGKLVALLVFAMNALIVILLLLSLFGLFTWKHLVLIFITKMVFDNLLLFKTAYYFKQQKVLTAAFLSSFIYPFFSMFVAIASLQGNYNWKGRTFKK
jgi:glycosyltransferase involved in cell wall biosynthesis